MEYLSIILVQITTDYNCCVAVIYDPISCASFFPLVNLKKVSLHLGKGDGIVNKPVIRFTGSDTSKQQQPQKEQNGNKNGIINNKIKKAALRSTF